MRIITRTVYGSALQTALLLGLPYTPPQNTTLNEKFDILKDAELDGELPHVRYMCIGNRGHRMTAGADGNPYTTPVNHRAKDAALYNHLPFVLRPLDDDLTIDKRANYGLRRIEVIDGVDYAAYYLMRIDTSQIALELQYNTVNEGKTVVQPFVPTSEALNPVPPEIPNSGVISTDGTYLSSSAVVPLILDAVDIDEFVNVSRVLYDTEDRAIISEIGLCSGVDRVTTADTVDGQFNYEEVIGTQIVSHITGYYPLGYSNERFELQIDAGATEPMLGETVR